jgi:hypothetical protein
MSIEDINYLLANSVPDSHLVIVDSSTRNKIAYPTPSEFMLSFDEPFANVFGIDVLDVAVSSTMYNIEKRNNKLVCMNVWFNPNYGAEQLQDDAFNKYYLSEISSYTPLNDMMAGTKQEVLVIADVDSEVQLDFPSSIVPSNNVLEDDYTSAIFQDDAIYNLGMTSSITAFLETLTSISVPFSELAINATQVYGKTVTGLRTKNVRVYDLRKANGSKISPFQFVSYATNDQPTKIAVVKRHIFNIVENFTKVSLIIESSNDLYFRIGTDIYRASGSLAEKLVVIFAGQQYVDVTETMETYYFSLNAVSYNVNVVHLSSSSNVRVWEPSNVVINDGSMTFLKADYITENTYYDLTRTNTLKWCPCILVNTNVIFEVGNYDLFGFVSYINNALVNGRIFTVSDDAGTFTYNFPFDNPLDIIQAIKINEQGDLIRTGRIIFQSQSQNVGFIIDVDRSTCLNSLGFSVVKSIYEELIFKEVSAINNRKFVTSIKNAEGFRKLAPPGVINLTGVRYMVLRCPEIESRIFSSFAYGKFCPGIGMFKLSTNQETVQQRLDFVNFVKKPFHPIGRLQKLTFRFELPDGALYDFRGVDMFMLLQIKYYAPKKKEVNMDGHVDSVLNPNYDPNFVRYMINRMAIDTQYAREDDGKVPSEAAKQIVRLQNEYDYSSEEEFEGDGNYSEEVPLYSRLA